MPTAVVSPGVKTLRAVLYKFRTYIADPAARERRWVRDTVFADRIRYAKMSELNDPFEGRPYVAPQFDDPRRQREEIYRASLDDARRAGLVGAAAQREAKLALMAWSAQIPDSIVKQKMAEAIDESFWVYCMTATRDPILMWSHYADGHKGLALHFDQGIRPFRNLYEVDYTDNYPEYRYPAANAVASCEAVQAMLHTKATEWLYEQEYRAIRVVESQSEEHRIYREMGMQWEGQIATLPVFGLIGVTLGAGMPEAVRRELTAELADRRPLVEVWQSVPALKTYELEFKRVR